MLHIFAALAEFERDILRQRVSRHALQISDAKWAAK
jgi:DNA invertase Pin-like site-specific DNA recombinase